MHGSVLQNEKYIKFSEKNTVEVLALQRLDEAIQKQDKRAGTYKAKDEAGNEVEYMLEWPGLTAKEIGELSSSKAGTFNDTGGIPYTAIVNPHTLEKMAFFKGGTSASSIMDSVAEQRKALTKQYGASIDRKELTDLRKQEASIRKEMEGGDLAKAFATYTALAKKHEKSAESLKARVAQLEPPLLDAATKALDEIEAGDLKSNAAKLDRLARALKGTSLEPRATELLARSKSS
jgi:hypothetical protein